jgi:hemerythrin-like domain-containing protein
LRYFRDAAPKHTADEEESLFPRLRTSGRANIEQLMQRIDALESDHVYAAEAHRKVDLLGRKWLADGRLAAPETAELSTQLASLAELYRRHIHLEDSEVFPAASTILTAEETKAIGEEMAVRRGISRK